MTLATLRRTIPDGTLLDWLELREVFGRAFTIPQLCDHWQLTQPAAGRRAHRLEAAGLAQADAMLAQLAELATRLGPSASDTHRLLITQTRCAATDLAL